MFLHIMNQMWLRSSVMWVGMYRHFGGTCYLCPEVRRVCLYAGLTVTWSVGNTAELCGSGGGIILCTCTEDAVTAPTLIHVSAYLAVSIYKTIGITSHGTCSVSCHIPTHSQCTVLKHKYLELSFFFQSLKLGTFDTGVKERPNCDLLGTQ